MLEIVCSELSCNHKFNVLPYYHTASYVTIQFHAHKQPDIKEFAKGEYTQPGMMSTYLTPFQSSMLAEIPTHLNVSRI